MKCKPGEPIPANQPNEGSVQGRKEKKRIKQRKAFIMVRIPFLLSACVLVCCPVDVVVGVVAGSLILLLIILQSICHPWSSVRLEMLS